MPNTPESPPPAGSGGKNLRASRAILGAALLAACQPAAPDDCKLVHVASLGLIYSKDHIFTPATLNNVPVNLMLDTGSQSTVVTKAASDRMGLPIISTENRAIGIGGSRSIYRFYADNFRLGVLHGAHLPLDVSNFDLAGYDPPADGILGTNVLSAYELDLDLWENQARLFKVVAGCADPMAALDQPLYAAELAHANPGDTGAYVHVDVGGKTLLALVDSGADSTVIFRSAARRLGLRIGDLKADPHFKSFGIGPRVRQAVSHVMTPISVGDITISNLPVSIVDQNIDDGTDMLLGMDFLSRVHVWLSFASHTMVMQYPPRPSPKLPD